MSDFKLYKKYVTTELRQVTQEDIDNYEFGLTWKIDISLSSFDEANGSPKIGDMIARNPKDHADMWLVSEEYFKNNYIET